MSKWVEVPRGLDDKVKVEICELKMKDDEEPADFLYRAFHSFPPEYEVHIKRQSATIIRRTRVDDKK